MTPYLRAQTRAEERFNMSLCTTRVRVEQTFGILKKRFPMLHFGIRCEPEMCVHVISACVVLHNVGIFQHDIVDNAYEIDVLNDNEHPNLTFNDNDNGTNIRHQITNTFFA